MIFTGQDVGELLPNVIHRVIPYNASISRIIVVGDVHGCLDELRELLAKVAFNQSSDVLLFTGDLGNRGPYSVQVHHARQTSPCCLCACDILQQFYKYHMLCGMASQSSACLQH